MDWLRFGIRDRVIRLFHNPDKCRSEAFIVPFYGAQYPGNFDTFIDWSVYYYGSYSKEELRLMRDFLGNIVNPVVLDIGANVGHHTLFAAMHADKVFSFEPFADVADRLRQKVLINRLQNVKVIDCALGSQNMLGDYNAPSTHNTGTGSFDKSRRGGSVLALPIRVGDEIIDTCGVHKVDFIKIDTEGFEPFVLNGLRKTLERYRPIVFMEWTHGEGKVNADTASKLFPPNYSLFKFIPEKVAFQIFRRPTYLLEPLASLDLCSECSVLAIPVEHLEYLRSNCPNANATKQIS